MPSSTANGKAPAINSGRDRIHQLASSIPHLLSEKLLYIEQLPDALEILSGAHGEIRTKLQYQITISKSTVTPHIPRPPPTFGAPPADLPRARAHN
ncbi:hypothetical protein ACWEOI_30200 [Nocardia sp. NPDC004340]